MLTLNPPQIVSTRSLPIHGATERRLVITVAPHSDICDIYLILIILSSRVDLRYIDLICSALRKLVEAVLLAG